MNRLLRSSGKSPTLDETFDMHRNHQRTLAAIIYLAISLTWLMFQPVSSARAAKIVASATPSKQLKNREVKQAWRYPVDSQVVLRDFWSPNGDFSAGHRGVDFAASEGGPVFAVGDGRVRFAGQVAMRGVVSITLDDGFVAEVEPVCPAVTADDQVVAGQQIGIICGGANRHCEVSCLHLSARRFNVAYARGFAYFTPLLFLGDFKESHLVAIGSVG